MFNRYLFLNEEEKRVWEMKASGLSWGLGSVWRAGKSLTLGDILESSPRTLWALLGNSKDQGQLVSGYRSGKGGLIIAIVGGGWG